MSDWSTCGGVPRISYADFANRIKPRISGERLPLDGSLELTFRCNLRCTHCYVNQPCGDRRAKRQELTTAEIFRIADEVVDQGCLWMLLTGGEILLRSDFVEIYLHMKKRGLLLSLFTNGTLITPRIADLFAEWPPLLVEISIYGSTPAVYGQVTGDPHSYRRCILGIERLLDRKVRLRLKTVPITLNFEDMGRMRNLAARYGLDLGWDPLVNCRVDGDDRPTAVRLSPAHIVALEKEEPKRVTHYVKVFQDRAYAEPRKEFFTCGAYHFSFHIDPYGNLLPCMLIRWPAYNLRDGTFRQGWYDSFPAMRNRTRTKALACDTCQFNAACDLCVGWAQLETKDPEGMVPFLCDVTRARAEAFSPRPELLLLTESGVSHGR
jgi:radical SAM protein with 4Fe4S-binding SPASM domain